MRIENKVFSCSFDRNFKGRVIRIQEEHLRKRFALSAKEVVLVWISDSIEDLLLSPKTHKFFRKIDCNNGFIWIQKISNKRGSFLEITKVNSPGGKHNLVVPAGTNFSGWKSFSELIKDFLNGKDEKAEIVNMDYPKKRREEGKTFADIVKNKPLDRPLVQVDSHCIHKEERFLERMEQSAFKSCKDEVRKIKWSEVLVVTKRDLHDDWGRILDIMQQQLDAPLVINPFHPDKALLKCPSEELAELLSKDRGWVSFGPFILKIERWNTEKHSRMSCVPCYGGWIQIRNLHLHLWRLNVFKAIGDCLGGFIEYEESNSLLIECVDLKLKIRDNYCSFIPAEVRIVDGNNHYIIQIVTFQDGNMLIVRVAEIHGSFSSAAAHAFHRGPNDPFFCPVDIWRIEDGIVYPMVNIQERSESLNKENRQLDGGTELFEISRQQSFLGFSEKAGPSKVHKSQAQVEESQQAQSDKNDSGESPPPSNNKKGKESRLRKRPSRPTLKGEPSSVRVITKSPCDQVTR